MSIAGSGLVSGNDNYSLSPLRLGLQMDLR